MKISIAMATYNGARYLQAQLESLACQTRLPDELVITDDGSSDDTLSIIQQFAATAPFKVVWEQNGRNLGYAGNFNKALSKTTGALVFLSDQDDVWFPEKLEVVERAAKGSGALVLMNDAAFVDEALNDLSMTKLGQLRAGGFSEEAFVMGCCAAIRREFLDLCMPIPTDFPSHDVWIVSIADGMGRREILRDVLQWYRRHDKNESQSLFNQTSTLTKWGVLREQVDRLKKRRGGGGQRGGVAVTNTYELLLAGVREAVIRASEPYSSELMAFAVDLDQKSRLEHDRHTIRRRPRLWRLARVARLWVSGAYANASGIKSAARDLLLP